MQNDIKALGSTNRVARTGPVESTYSVGLVLLVHVVHHLRAVT